MVCWPHLVLQHEGFDTCDTAKRFWLDPYTARRSWKRAHASHVSYLVFVRWFVIFWSCFEDIHDVATAFAALPCHRSRGSRSLLQPLLCVWSSPTVVVSLITSPQSFHILSRQRPATASSVIWKKRRYSHSTFDGPLFSLIFLTLHVARAVSRKSNQAASLNGLPRRHLQLQSITGVSHPTLNYSMWFMLSGLTKRRTASWITVWQISMWRPT